MNKINTIYIMLTKPVKAIFLENNLWLFFFETVLRNELIYFYRSNFPIFGVLIGGDFRTMTHCVHRRHPKFSSFLKFSYVVCVKISVTISRNWPCFIWSISIAKLWMFHDEQRLAHLFLGVLHEIAVCQFE